MAKASKRQTDTQELSEEAKLYNQVVACAELSNIQLIHINFDVQPRYFFEEPDEEDQANLGYEISVDETHYEPGEGMAACMMSFDVSAGDSQGAALQCKAKYAVSYRLGEVCNEQAVETFLRRVGVFACYPYFRGLFAQIDWAANTHLPPLPIHKESRGKKSAAGEADSEQARLADA